MSYRRPPPLLKCALAATAYGHCQSRSVCTMHRAGNCKHNYPFVGRTLGFPCDWIVTWLLGISYYNCLAICCFRHNRGARRAVTVSPSPRHSTCGTRHEAQSGWLRPRGLTGVTPATLSMASRFPTDSLPWCRTMGSRTMGELKGRWGPSPVCRVPCAVSGVQPRVPSSWGPRSHARRTHCRLRAAAASASGTRRCRGCLAVLPCGCLAARCLAASLPGCVLQSTYARISKLRIQ